MRTNEEAVKHQLERINSNPVKRKQKLHDKSWDISLLDNHQVGKMTTQELAKKLVFGSNEVDGYGRTCTVYRWHFDNSNSWGYGKQGVIKTCEYWLRKKNTQLLGHI